MSIEEKVIKATIWSYQKDVRREVFEAAYKDWREEKDRLERRKEIVTAIGFVVWVLIAGVAVSIL
jgi:hypothetical protein